MDAFTTIRHARDLKRRHPKAPRSAAHVLLVLATYANGRTGSNIRPGHELVEEHVGLERNAVRLAIQWLIEHGELRRDKPGHNGSAAHYTIPLDAVGTPTQAPTSAVGARGEASRGSYASPLQPEQEEGPAGPSPAGPHSAEPEPDAFRKCPKCGGNRIQRMGENALFCETCNEHEDKATRAPFGTGDQY